MGRALFGARLGARAASQDAVPEGGRAFLARLLAQVPALGDAAAIAKRLGRLLRREGQALDRVLADAVSTPLADVAAGLGRDRAAAQAALDTHRTTNPAEGQFNRVMAIERSMSGRAGFALSLAEAGAHRSGRGGRTFESCHSDHSFRDPCVRLRVSKRLCRMDGV